MCGLMAAWQDPEQNTESPGGLPFSPVFAGEVYLIVVRAVGRLLSVPRVALVGLSKTVGDLLLFIRSISQGHATDRVVLIRQVRASQLSTDETEFAAELRHRRQREVSLTLGDRWSEVVDLGFFFGYGPCRQ